MPRSLESVLASIPGLAGYEAARQRNEQTGLNELQQAGAVMSLQQVVQKAQQEQALRADLQALGPNPTQEQLAGVGAKYAGAKELLTSQTASMDRKAMLEAANLNREAAREQAQTLQTERLAHAAELARQRSEDQRLSQEERNQARMDMIRLTASLRPAPAERNLQLVTDANGMQLIVNPDGTTRPLTTQDGAGVRKPVAADKPMTEFQGKAALYGTRSAQSDKILKALEDTISKAGLAAGQATGIFGNAAMSSEQQRVSQAQRDFVNAVLRQESGAVISDQEFANAKQQYFPAPGDKPEVVAQKRANRQLAIQGFARMSGPKGASDIKAIIDEPLLPGVSAITPTPKQAGGAAPTGFADAEKERRYQEWKAKQRP